MTTIEVFADVRCPFTHVGIRRFLERRDAAGGGPTLIVRAWPLELVNDAPMDPAKIGEEIDAIDAVALMTDTDNSGQNATAWYGDIVFTAR